MSEQINEVKLIWRRWDRDSGLSEQEKIYASLEEIYGACLNANNLYLIDRLTIRGMNQTKSGRSSLSFSLLPCIWRNDRLWKT